MIGWEENRGTAMLEQSRRGFLKASSLVTLGAAFVGADAQEKKQEGTESRSSAEPVSDLTSLVNILQGTNSDFYFSRGNTLPIAALPFGMAHWTLQSRSPSPWMFQP